MTLSRAGSRSQSEPSTESLAEALTALCAEVGIPFEEMLHTVEAALATAYVRAFNPPGEVRVKLDTKTGALEVTGRVVRADGSELVRALQNTLVLALGTASLVVVLNSLIAQHVDAIVVSANDPDALVPTLRRASQRGIKVISYDSAVNGGGRTV